MVAQTTLSTQKSVIYSQALRHRTITTDNTILKFELKELKTHPVEQRI